MTHPTARFRVQAIIAGAFLVVLAFLPVAPVVAHHGWGTFDTRHAYYVAGTIAKVRWGNPHSDATLRVEKADLPADWSKRELPPGANETNGRLTLASARPYIGDHRELHLVLAGPAAMERWGLSRPLAVGELIEAVGFLAPPGETIFVQSCSG